MLPLTDEEREIARFAIENASVDLRDARISVLRNNGLCIKERDGSPSHLIRMCNEDAVEIGIKAILEHRDRRK